LHAERLENRKSVQLRALSENPVDILRRGASAWNEWRAINPNLSPLLRGCDLGGIQAIGADLHGVDLRDAQLCGGILTGADLRDAQLSRSDLTRADLAGARLSWANAVGTTLIDANLSGADCRGADLRNAGLRRAILIQTDFRGATVTYGDLTEANLEGAGLNGTNLTGSDLVKANLDSALLLETILADVNLCGTKNLTTCIHLGPSIIDSRTLAKSGDLPVIFLRGCGLPDLVIGALHPNYHSCFISYSTKDQDFADRFYADLQAKGVRCWFAPHDIQGGRKIHEQIDEAIRLHDKLLLILSDASMSSAWVKTEIANARAKEEQLGRQMLFPITVVPLDRIKAWKLFDADAGIDSAREIREYFIPDFSNWKDHDSYAKAFERLVRDLKAGPGAQPAR
jgi:uncharacterized protein YjbI with pentapeptide repeats